LFTIAGMVPFKPYFVGEKAPYQRAVSIQKCFRAPDIDIIGTTSRHLTFFEMMGNFSFGDYFKHDAVQFAWSLITEGFGLDPERLWVTVHDSDDDAAEIWRDVVGVRPERIQRLDEDNFWGMGDTGPCGPCSEIFFDKGPQYGADGGPAFGGDERFVEFWNLVFMQYERAADGSLSDLPTKNIDTGSGFERVLSILNGVDSVFATDLFAPLLRSGPECRWASLRSRHRNRYCSATNRRTRTRNDSARCRRRASEQRGSRVRASAHHSPCDSRCPSRRFR
jgi:alanyl-tRNA synthetase